VQPQSDENSNGGSARSSTGGKSASGGKGGTGGSISSGGSGGSVSGGTSGGGGSTGGAGTDGGIDAGAGGGGGAAVGNPALFTQSVLEMDFAPGQNGRFRANGGAWQDFGAWNTPGNNGSWRSVGVSIQTTNQVRTEVVQNAVGTGRVLRTWIEADDRAVTTTGAVQGGRVVVRIPTARSGDAYSTVVIAK
jgi:hypothetical protein